MTIVNLRRLHRLPGELVRINTEDNNSHIILAYGQMSFSLQLHLGNERMTARALANLVQANLRPDLVDLDREERALAKLISATATAPTPEERETLQRQVNDMEAKISHSEWLNHLLGRAQDHTFDVHDPVQEEYVDVALSVIPEGRAVTYAEWMFGGVNDLTETLDWFGIHDAVIMSQMLRDPRI